MSKKKFNLKVSPKTLALSLAGRENKLQFFQTLLSTAQGPEKQKKTEFAFYSSVQQVFIIFLADRYKAALLKRDFDSEAKIISYVKVISSSHHKPELFTSKSLSEAYRNLGYKIDSISIEKFLSTKKVQISPQENTEKRTIKRLEKKRVFVNKNEEAKKIDKTQVIIEDTKTLQENPTYKLKFIDFGLVNPRENGIIEDGKEFDNLFDTLMTLAQYPERLQSIGFFQKSEVQRVFLIYLASTYKTALEVNAFSTSSARSKLFKAFFQSEYEANDFNLETISSSFTKLGLVVEFSLAQKFLEFVDAKKTSDTIEEKSENDPELSFLSVWSDERLKLLEELWNNGLSMREIAKKLGITRNSVAGKVHRLKLLPKRSGQKHQFYKPRFKDVNPATLMELCRAIFRNALVNKQSNLRTEKVQQHKEILLITLNALELNDSFRNQLINSYLTGSKSWHAFKEVFPDILIPILPHAATHDQQITNLKLATEKFGKQFDKLTRSKIKKKSDKQIFSSSEVNVTAEGFEEDASLWLEGLEKHEVSRNYTTLTDIADAFSSEDDKRALMKISPSYDKGVVNKDYKSVVDNSLNPTKQNSLNYLFQTHEATQENRGTIEETQKYQQVKVRTQQSKFRKIVLEAYSYCCCISGYSVEPALHAAHIQDFSISNDNSLKNGLCLRADIHILFDKGLIKVTDEFAVEISNELRDTAYWEYNERKISLPVAQIDWPNKKSLDWKRKNT